MKQFLFILFCILALIVGVYPLVYVFVEHKYTFLGSKSSEVLQNQIWKLAFFLHIFFGGVSLFIGWRQFGNQFRNKHLKLHRIIGKSYVFSVLISSVAAIYMGIYANGGMISSIGFITLGLVWFITTLSAVIQIRKGNVIMHRQLMIYSYACTFAAVTLRLWYPLLKSITQDSDTSYLVVAWLCWLPNLLAAYLINKKIEAS